MRTWTKNQLITAIILFILLILDFSQSALVLIYDDVLSPSARETAASLRLWTILLYGAIYFGSFPAIALILHLNQDRLQDLNVDKFYVLFLVVAGSIGIYLLPYNCFAGIALIYLIYILFDRMAKFGAMHHSAMRILLVIAGVFAAIILCIVRFADVTTIDSGQVDQWLHKYWQETIPISVYQEVVYRGILYKFLKDLGFGETKVLYTVAFLFWISHINYLLNSTIGFWIILPLVSLMFGYVASRTRSLAASTVLHVLYNFIAGYSRLFW